MAQFKTLHGLDEKLLDKDYDRPSISDEEMFNDWLKRHGYSSKEEYYRDIEAANAEEW